MALAVLTLVLALTWRMKTSPPAENLKIAVMPFEPIAAPSALEPGNAFAEGLVHHLVAASNPTLDVIGPTTTEAFPEHTGALGQWIESDGIDYVINGRELMGNDRPRVLVEIIRGRDGAHVWAQYMDQLPEGLAGVEVIAEALSEEIAHPRERRP